MNFIGSTLVRVDLDCAGGKRELVQSHGLLPITPPPVLKQKSIAFPVAVSGKAQAAPKSGL